ncbi:MAG: preprotein translocase subunit YajC [Candidatus Omnitrophica bacterium]|nr:preprotein translocase subunit YajC [Candidatus Omnitrophota bacterium]
MQPNSGAGILNIFFMMAVFAIWYFLLIRPQQKKQKDHQAMIANLKKNTEIITTGGLHGTIVNVKDKTFVLRIDDAAKVEIDKNCVAFVKSKKEN